MPAFRPAIASVGVVILTAISGCSSSGSSSATTYAIKAGDTSCQVTETTLRAGDAVFAVENTGSDVTEVYVYGEQDGEFTQIVGEVENVGPGTSRDFTVSLTAGRYQVACKPGMRGDGIRTDLIVSGAGGSSTTPEQSGGQYDRELEFEITSSGGAEPPADPLTATSGERIEFKLHNRSGEAHYLEVLDPDGRTLGTAEAAAGADAEFIATLSASGSYTVSLYAAGAEGSATTTPLTVTD